MTVYIYIICTPNLELGITVFDQEREQGRFRGRGSNEGARGSAGRAFGRSKDRRFWLLREPDLAAPYLAVVAPMIEPTVLPSSVCYCLDSYNYAFVPSYTECASASTPSGPRVNAEVVLHYHVDELLSGRLLYRFLHGMSASKVLSLHGSTLQFGQRSHSSGDS